MSVPRYKAQAVAVLMAALLVPATTDAQTNQFQGITNATVLGDQIMQAFTTALAQVRASGSCDPSVWGKLHGIYDDAQSAILRYDEAPLGAFLRTRVARVAIRIGDSAIPMHCDDEAHRAFVAVVEDFPAPADSYLRERAQIGLDDLRQRQLLDALGRR